MDKKMKNDCIACEYSGSDEAAYAAHGCPEHTCYTPKFVDFSNGRPKRKYVKERLVECPLCKKRKMSFWDPCVCNHNQEEEGEPTPLVFCREV